MAEVILHIGPHKTGTTAIQQFLFRNRDGLRDQGILYRTSGGTPDHNALAAAFRTGASPTEAGQAFIARLLKDAGDQRVLISSEMLSESGIDANAFLACFEGHMVGAIGYLRHPYDLMVSAYNQRVRDPRARRREPMGQDPLPYDVSLRSALGRWLDRVPVVVCPYDPAQWPERSLTRDFLRTIGVDDRKFAHDDRRENRSLSPTLLEAVRLLNVAGVEEAARSAVIDILSHAETADEPAAVDPEMLAECLSTLSQAMPLYAPFLREGMDTAFLFAEAKAQAA